MKFYFLLLTLCLAVGFTSCGSDCSATEYATEVAAQSEKVSTAANAYSADPTNDTLCEDYSAELTALIAVYDKYIDCDDVNVAGILDTAKTSTQSSIDALPCN